MTLKTPSFWYPKDDAHDWRVFALKPVSNLYALAYHIHQSGKSAKKVDIPVICVGNLVAGGTGKTPTSIAVLDILKQSGITQNPFFLIRGYGGAEHGPLLVEPDKHSAWDVGDESLILAQHAPTIVAADRVEGANLAHAKGADLVLMDDGLQNPGIFKDFKIVVINGEMGFGNGLMMPAGPMREPMDKGLAKADAFLMIGEDKRGALSSLPADSFIMHGHLKTKTSDIPNTEITYLAFAGLGYPDKFFNYLKDILKLNVANTIAYADHCPYEVENLETLLNEAKELDAKLITTEKDYLRLPENFREHVVTVPVALNIQNPDMLISKLKEKLQ